MKPADSSVAAEVTPNERAGAEPILPKERGEEEPEEARLAVPWKTGELLPTSRPFLLARPAWRSESFPLGPAPAARGGSAARGLRLRPRNTTARSRLTSHSYRLPQLSLMSGALTSEINVGMECSSLAPRAERCGRSGRSSVRGASGPRTGPAYARRSAGLSRVTVLPSAPLIVGVCALAVRSLPLFGRRSFTRPLQPLGCTENEFAA